MYSLGTFFYSIEKAVCEGKARDIDEAMYKTVQAGITGIDVHSDIADYYDINFLTDAMKKNGMSIASIHCARPSEYKSEEKISQSVQNFKNAADFAKSIGSGFFMLVPTMPSDFKDREFISFRTCARELIGEVSKYAESIGLVPTIEDYSLKTTAYGRFEDIKYILDKNPGLMFTYDSGNFVLAGNDEITGAQLFADRTVYVHMKDLAYDEKRVEFVRDGVAYDSVAIGDGFIRTEKALEILRDGRFKSGIITIESGMTYDSFEKMIKSAEFLKRII